MSSTDNRLGARRRGYDKAHEKWRQRVLARSSVCAFCGGPGQPDDVADHITPIRKGGARFDPRNGQRLHRSCHSGPKQYQDNTGKVRGCDANGIPLDSTHRWRSLSGPTS